MNITPEQKEKLVKRALHAVLNRIRDQKEISYHMGPGTATFEIVTAAFSAVTGQPLDDVREKTCKGSAEISSPMEDIVEILT